MDENKHGPLQIGQKFLGKYEVRSLLGRGGYAYVYECVDLFLGRSVALKVFKPVSSGPADVERQAQKEARALLLVSDERLVKLIDAGAHEGLVYLVMEKLNGRTLRDALQELKRLTVPEALYIMLQVARALAAAHRAGVIHRDVKPENIFIEAELKVKVLDLGIAKVQGLGAQTTHKDGLKGTVLYMAPEQLQGHGVTPRADIYALGVVGFEMLHHHHLYLGDAPPGYQEAAWRQISFMPPMLDELDPAIPRDVAKLVRRMLLKVAEQRYESMDQVIDALLAALKRVHDEWAPQGRFITRALHEPLAPQLALGAQGSVVLGHLPLIQATMTDPALPLPARPSTDPGAAQLAFVVSTPASGRTTAERPGSPGSPAADPQRQKTREATRNTQQPVVLPNTPAPVAAPMARRSVAGPPPFLKDPAIKLAGVAAVCLASWQARVMAGSTSEETAAQVLARRQAPSAS